MVEGKGYKWRGRDLPRGWSSSIRPRILLRDDYTCQVCKVRFSARELEVDHVGDKDDHRDVNLRALCKGCHAARTRAQARAAQRRAHQAWLAARKRPEASQPHPGLLPVNDEEPRP